jgi:hypothetical protein
MLGRRPAHAAGPATASGRQNEAPATGQPAATVAAPAAAFGKNGDADREHSSLAAPPAP